jgi:hypothetical protein
MGWTASGDMRQQVRLHFDTAEEAIAYCERYGIPYQLSKPKLSAARSFPMRTISRSSAAIRGRIERALINFKMRIISAVAATASPVSPCDAASVVPWRWQFKDMHDEFLQRIWRGPLLLGSGQLLAPGPLPAAHLISDR